MPDSEKKEILKHADEILSELGVSKCKILFKDFFEISRDPMKKAQGYHPEYHARCNPTNRTIELNSYILQSNDFSHWRNWDNVIAHECGHIILNTPKVLILTSDDNIGLVLTRYQWELYNIAQDMTILNHVVPEKYSDYSPSKIKPWERYSEAIRKVRDSETRFGLQLGIIQKLPFYYGYGNYYDNEEGFRILREINRILIQEPILRTLSSDTERLVKPYAKGKDSRESDLQRYVDQGLEYYRFWVASQGKW